MARMVEVKLHPFYPVLRGMKLMGDWFYRAAIKPCYRSSRRKRRIPYLRSVTLAGTGVASVRDFA
jgi:hypothetical protein